MPTDRLALGIDTGGTYTDAVVVAHGNGAVISTAKALTTPDDLSAGIVESLTAALDQACDGGDRSEIAARMELVSLSTTLATNALVQGHGHSTCLLLIGYDQRVIDSLNVDRGLAADEVILVPGGHDGMGTEVAELDEEAVRRAVRERLQTAESFAVSGYFAVRNPAHELRARALIEEESAGKLAITCGHELASQLDSVRRATTTALNGRLIPLIRRLIAAVQHSLDGLGIAAPLMIVKGDGSLAQADWAMARPIETILSGPAASVVGACHLAGQDNASVVDIGGTTTDIAIVRDGLPRRHPEGGRVGGWRTMVQTVDVRTAGLGGDSAVRLSTDGHRDGVTIGPNRVVPLSLLGRSHAGIVGDLRQQLREPSAPDLAAQFVFAREPLASVRVSRPVDFLASLDSTPRSLAVLVGGSPYGRLGLAGLAELEARLAVQRAGFTPTDALHALGRVGFWETEPARLGAELLARHGGLSTEAFCESVLTAMSRRLTGELVTKIVSDETSTRRPPETIDGELFSRSIGAAPESGLECQLSLKQALVVVGAPARAYAPQMAQHLHAELVIPDHAAVGGAIGAVASRVVQQCRASVRPTEREGIILLVLPDGTRSVGSFAEGLAQAREEVPRHLEQLMRASGAEEFEIRVVQNDLSAPTNYGDGAPMLVETELLFTAVGWPRTS